MYHIVLVDDEKIAIDGLYEVVAEEFRECEVYKAGNGSEALELFAQKRIDIAVIDINMPGISGLELQAVVQKKWNRCKCIFLTGYDRADYVRQAMRNGGTDYILKLEGDDVVVDAIRRNLKLLEEEEKKRLENAQMRQRLTENRQQLRQYLLHRLITEPVRDAAEFLNQCGSAEIGIDFHKPVWMLAGKLANDSADSQPDRRRNMETLEMIFREMVDVPCHMESVQDKDSILVCFFQAAKQAEYSGLNRMRMREMQSQVLEYLELVQDRCYAELEKNVLFTAWEDETGLLQIYPEYQMLKMSFFQKSFSGQEDTVLLKKDAAPYITYEAGAKQEKDLFPVICDYVRSGMKKDAHLALLHILYRGRSNLEDSAYISQSAFYECALTMHRLIDQYGLWEEMNKNYTMSRLLEFHDFAGAFEVEYYFADLLHKIFQLLEAQGSVKSDKVIAKINSYIHSHLKEDLSMNVLSELAHFNPSYLSRLYKKKMGISISDYIAQVRLKKACALLAETDKKVSDIAAETGFASAGYFSSSFGKEYGVTPLEYRLREGGGN